ncbi:virion-associated phage protein [Burkholderia phage Bcep22]|uniref:Virion-associated phage protein n=1 Tax=Burkholderia phage Bcep22 TaxID=2883944 RepID=Q6V7N3_9CAUD|nr:head protein [Burkholderia phage Bcep22]AAQ54993.1 virion-associated phage protein [Burkholderia phage Bcep22]
MSAASDYTENNVINSLLRGVAFPLPTKTYLSLHTADPGDAGGNEVTTAAWPAYVRKDAEVGGAIGSGWAPPANGTTTNSNQVIYPAQNGASAITVTHFAIYDAPTGGNMLAHAALNTARTLQPGDVFVFDVGSLTVQML